MAGVVERQQEEGLGQVLSEGVSPREVREPASAASPGSRAPWNGPLVVFVPLVLSACAVWWMRHPGVSLVPSRPPARVDPETTQEVLGGELELARSTLVFWLAPADLDAGRQAFQSQALRKRYALDEGEPWRLRLEWRAGEAADILPSSSSIDLSQLVIEDQRGRALAPLHLDRELDPLAILLQPPAVPLEMGASIDLVLWGRAPGVAAKLVGFEMRDSSDPDGLRGHEFQVNLSSRPLRKGDLVGPLARLDSAPAALNPKPEGKTAQSGASALPVRGSDGARY